MIIFFVITLLIYDLIINLKWIKDHYVKIQFSFIVNYLIYRLHKEFPEMFFLSFQTFKKVFEQFFIEILFKVFVEGLFLFKAFKRNEKEHFLNYYIVFKQTERRRVKYLKNLIIEILRITIWAFKDHILNCKKRKKLYKTQRPASELSISLISLKIYIIKAIFFIQLIKDLKIELFIIIMINIEKILREKSFSNSTILLFEKY